MSDLLSDEKERCSQIVGPALRRFAADTRAALANARVEVFTGSAARYPAISSVSISEPSPSGDELVVLEVALWCDGARARWTCDLSTGDGTVLSEVTPLDIDFNRAKLAAQEWLQAAVEFIQNTVPSAVEAARGGLHPTDEPHPSH